MKKFFALLLTLCLCLTAVSVFAEEAAEEIPAFVSERTYEGNDVAIGDTGLVISIPADWNLAEVPEGYYFAYTNPDNTITISLLPAQDINTCWAAVEEMIAAGTAKDLMEVYINDIYYMLYSTADGLFNFAYLPITDENCIAICFGVTSEDIDGSISLEMLGSVAFAEEAAE